MGTFRRRFRYAVAAVLPLLAAACSSAGDPVPTKPYVYASTSPVVPAVSPYLDVLSGTTDITAISQQTGQHDFALSFVVADSAGTCTPTWGGSTPLTDTAVKNDISQINDLGGKVIVATGGATGKTLESVCGRAALTDAYEMALDAAGSNVLDVDVEQAVTADTVTAALADLQKDRNTVITLTLPVAGTEQGLADAGVALLKSAKAAGVVVTVNAMTMNFEAPGDWGTAMVTATEAVHDDLAAIWTDLDEPTLYAMLGVTPMIGVNDTGPVTTVADAQTLLTYAKEKGLGFVRYRAVNRDNDGCPDGQVSSTCSGIVQADYEFTKLFAGFTV